MAENPSDLVGKEFIFEYGLDRITPPSEKTGGMFALEQRAYRRERVVRCHDCAHCHVVPDGSTAFCDQLYDKPDWGLPAPYTGSEPAQMLEVGPEDFCSWGKERET